MTLNSKRPNLLNQSTTKDKAEVIETGIDQNKMFRKIMVSETHEEEIENLMVLAIMTLMPGHMEITSTDKKEVKVEEVSEAEAVVGSEVIATKMEASSETTATITKEATISGTTTLTTTEISTEEKAATIEGSTTMANKTTEVTLEIEISTTTSSQVSILIPTTQTSPPGLAHP